MQPGNTYGGPSSAGSTSSGYLPALDGLRGACLLAVLLFHSGFAWMSGGFLGVSTFFTLSGYLITSLLLAQRDALGRVALRAFWARRLRRLLPAALLTVACIVVLGPRWLPAGQRERLAEDALATLVYVVNWRFMSPEYAYSLIFVDPSPLQHFWSLAIEGQFYLVFPLVVGSVLRLGGGTRALAVVCAVLTAASILVCLTGPGLEEAQHRLYYGTDARAGELLVGALLALAQRSSGGFARDAAARALRIGGPIAALLLVYAWSSSSVGDGWLYRGGFAGYALASAVVIAAATLPAGLVRSVLAVAWLRWIGAVSYGAYLFHWPLFLFLTPARTGLGVLPLFVVRVTATLALAALSYRFVERPIRRGTALPGARFTWATVAALLLVAAFAIATNPVLIQARVLDTVHAGRRLFAGEPRASGLRFAIYGDSTARQLWNGLEPWLRDEAASVVVNGYTKQGCGLFVFGEMEKRGFWSAESKDCRGMAERWQRATQASRPDVAIVLVGPWEVRNKRRSRYAPSLKLGDPELDHATRAAITEAVDALAAGGAKVVWLTSPHIKVPPLNGQTFDDDRASSEPVRIDRLNALINAVARSRPDKMRVVDLGAYLRSRPGGEFDQSIRVDDVHFTAEGGAEISRAWLGPAILSAARELRPQ